MDLREVLRDVAEGELGVEEALKHVEGFSRVGDFARLDMSRENRTGVPEAVLAEGKGIEDLVEIARDYLDNKGHVIITRLEEGKGELEMTADSSDWYPRSNTLVLRSSKYEAPEVSGRVGVVTAGTSDVDVAEEAVITAEEMGCEVVTMYDVGVAGVHRLLSDLEELDGCDALVVAAGREGALPTVVAGLVDAPVIGLPVSVGYGYGGDGEAALAGMLQSCSVLSVVNVDAGFVAGAQAARIARD